MGQAAETLGSPSQENSPTDGAQSPAVANLWTRKIGEDWPQFLGPRFDGTSSEKGIRRDWKGGKLPVLWSRRLDTSYGIGSTSQGRYLQFDRVGDVERLLCLHAESGEELWASDQPVEYEDLYGYNNGPRTSPLIEGHLVWTLGVAGQLTCRDLRDGQILWTVNTNKIYGVIQNFFGVGGSPLVIGDHLIVMVGGSPASDQELPPGQLDRVSPNGSALVAFDKKTGQEKYRVGDYLASYSSPRPIIVDGRTIVVCFTREGLMAIDPESGAELWHVPWRSRKIESVNAAVPTVRGSQVLISECYEIGSLLLDVTPQQATVIRSDQDLRRDKSFRAHWATPICIGDSLFGCSGRNPPDSDLRCIDWLTGKVNWLDPRRERTSLLAIDDHLVVLGERGELELIEASPVAYRSVTSISLAEVDPAWPDRPRLLYPCWAAPIVSHGLMYVRGDNAVICFELIPQE
jgi:outer membrane protein assembly factor BamB